MKKILYITTIGTTVNAFLISHIEMLVNNGYKVDCACFLDVPIDEKLRDIGVEIYNIPFSRNPLDLKNINAFLKLVKIQKENKYDVVHVHTPIASVYGRFLKFKFPSLKILYTAHGFHFYEGATKLKWCTFYNIEKIMSNFTDVIITMNEYDYIIAKNKFKSKKVVKVNGVGVELKKYTPKKYSPKFKLDLGLDKDDLVITVIGELSKRKNQMQAIYSIERLIKKHKNIKLLLVGDGYLYNEIYNYINKKGLNKNIKLLGYRKDIPNILSITDIVGLFSYHEGLPRNLMEAMVAKKPIVCTNIRGSADLVKNNKNGYLVELNNIEATIKSIERLYEDEKLRLKMGNLGFDMIQDYSLDIVLNQMIEIYKTII